jgi:hypothetical protein
MPAYSSHLAKADQNVEARLKTLRGVVIEKSIRAMPRRTARFDSAPLPCFHFAQATGRRAIYSGATDVQ